MMVSSQPRKVVNVYIDGYNFYESINKPDLLHLGWCDLSKLADRLTSRAFGGRCALGVVKYYTAKVTDRTRKRLGEVERQALWLAALDHATDVWVVYGEFRKYPNSPHRKEKRTDTNIAIGMVRDALVSQSIAPRKIKLGSDRPAPCDAVLLVSGDDDLRPAIEMIANEYGKEAAVFWPLDAPPAPASTSRIVFGH